MTKPFYRPPRQSDRPGLIIAFVLMTIVLVVFGFPAAVMPAKF